MSFTRNLQDYLKRNNHSRYESTLSCDDDVWSNSIDDYQFLSQIGSGSFGQVFKAKIDERECAIKRICKARSPNISKILSEVSIHIRLCHSHILQLFNVVEDGTNVYLIMELCRGGSLSQLISREVNHRKSLSGNNPKMFPSYPLKPVLPYIMISTILQQICSALAYLHRNSIVHRDLNLNNILLVKPVTLLSDSLENASSIHIKLADFGLAIDQNYSSQIKLNNSLTTNIAAGNTICGTPGFISPEIWTQMRTVSYKSDIYSLGSIVFACIAGYTPNGDITLNNFLPMTADLITCLLNENPEHRPELVDILNHIFIYGRIDSRRLHPIEKTTKNMFMSIDKSGTMVLRFLKGDLTISVTRDGSEVSINKANSTIKYLFYELPEVYWKRYSYLVRFIELVKSKTAKITIHCAKWFREACPTNMKEYISRCSLMENGEFQVTVHNQVLNESFRFELNKDNLSTNLQRFQEQLKALREKICDIEREFTEMEHAEKMDLFPISFGFDERLYEFYEKDKSKTEELNQNSLLMQNSAILRSIQIKDIGQATQFSNGALSVNFNDGSGLCLDSDSQVFYMENSVLKKFNKDDIIPEVVLNKIARMPQVISHLKKCNATDLEQGGDSGG